MPTAPVNHSDSTNSIFILDKYNNELTGVYFDHSYLGFLLVQSKPWKFRLSRGFIVMPDRIITPTTQQKASAWGVDRPGAMFLFD